MDAFVFFFQVFYRLISNKLEEEVVDQKCYMEAGTINEGFGYKNIWDLVKYVL